MKIANLLKCKNIIKISESKSKDEVLSFLINHLIDSYPEENFDDEFKQKVIDTVFERESQSTTGMGGHIAFPHGRVAGLNKPLIALGIVNDGLEYGSPDNKKVKLIFLFLFPGNRHDLGVKIQSVFARFLMADNCTERLIATEKAEDIYKMIEDAELVIDSPIAAQDVMCNPKIRLSGDTPLLTATSKMNEFNTEVAPVVDEEGKVVGEVNCIHLFQMDLPDYIKKLHSMPPIHDFKPFNKYFSENASLMVKDVINSEIAEIEPDTSLMEIIFLLAVKKYTIVYVCDAGKLVGVIDRITVLDKVFNI